MLSGRSGLKPILRILRKRPRYLQVPSVLDVDTNVSIFTGTGTVSRFLSAESFFVFNSLSSTRINMFVAVAAFDLLNKYIITIQDL